jgi:hypothetical protein
MDRQKEMTKFVICPSKWSKSVEISMLRAFHVIPKSHFDAMKTSKVFRVKHGNKTIAFFCLDIDGEEGVMFGAAANCKTLGLYDLCLPYVESLFSGVKSIRVHVERPGAGKILARHGYTAQEIVMRKVL